MGSKPVVIKTDSSTGIAQIFAKTAINALNNARARGFISLSEPYDFNDYEDAWYVWEAQSMRLAKEKDVDVKAEEGKKRNLKTVIRLNRK